MPTDDNFLVINLFENRDGQRWRVAGDRVQKFVDPSQVLDIFECNEDEGSKICQYEFHGNDNQLWDFVFQ